MTCLLPCSPTANASQALLLADCARSKTTTTSHRCGKRADVPATLDRQSRLPCSHVQKHAAFRLRLFLSLSLGCSTARPACSHHGVVSGSLVYVASLTGASSSTKSSCKNTSYLGKHSCPQPRHSLEFYSESPRMPDQPILQCTSSKRSRGWLVLPLRHVRSRITKVTRGTVGQLTDVRTARSSARRKRRRCLVSFVFPG